MVSCSCFATVLKTTFEFWRFKKFFEVYCVTIRTLEKATAPHSGTLAWRIPWQRSLEGCSPWGRLGSDTTERLHFHFSLSCIGEGNGNPLQCSCLENPRDGEASWAAVYGVAQSRTRLKRLSSSSSIEWIVLWINSGHIKLYYVTLNCFGMIWLGPFLYVTCFS